MADEDNFTTQVTSDTSPVAQSPVVSELVTSSQTIGDGDKVQAKQDTDTSVNVQSVEGSELVTSTPNLIESAIDAREPSVGHSIETSESTPTAMSAPFRVRIDDTDYGIVDYDEDVDDILLLSATPHADTSPVQAQVAQERSHATIVVGNWNDYDITGFKILRASEDVANRVRSVINHFFYPNNFPKLGLFWTDLFSNNVFPKKIVDVESGLCSLYYENSTRATVPLFDWVRGRSDVKFAGFNLTDDAVRDTLSFETFVLQSIMPSLGFNPDLVAFSISGMSILLQPPLGGISQAIHTDDYPECPLGEWISLLFPCHQQRSTVFLSKDLSTPFGKATGVKPFFNIGDLAAWSKIRHFGSGAEAVDASMFLRSGLFVFVHVTPLPARVPHGMAPVTGDVSEGNRDESGEEVIQYGPDVIHWTGGLVPIIRVCVSCLHGVNYDYEAQRPSDESEEMKHDRFATCLLFCTECVHKQPVPGSEARVQSLLCQWCRGMDAFYPLATFPDLDPTKSSECVVTYLYQSVLDVQLCTHGKKHFQRLPNEDALFVLFSHQEIAKSCQFWLDFLKTYDFTTVYAPTEFSHTSPQWSVFWEIFMSNSSCARARMLCWIGAMIAGIGPVLSKKGKKVYHGGYPVFFHSDLWNRESGLNAFSKMIAACDDGVRLVFHQARLLKLTRRVLSHVEQTYWEYSMRCQCQVPRNAQRVDDNVADHREVTFCTGPTLRRNVQQTLQHVNESEKAVAEGFVLRCRQLFWNVRASDGGT